MKPTVMIAAAVLVPGSAVEASAQVPMPDDLRGTLYDRPSRALSILKRNPTLANATHVEGKVTPLHIAAQMGHEHLVRWLTGHGANVDARCYNDFAPLHLAANGQVARILLRAGARFDLKTSWGDKAMHYAAKDVLFGNYHRAGVVEAIRAAGEPLDIATALCLGKPEKARLMIRLGIGAGRSIDGLTPLHIAARTGDIQTAIMLIARGARVNGGEYVGMNFGGRHTPLWHAIMANRTAMVRFLLMCGADPTLLGRQYEHALEHPNAEIRVLVFYYGLIYETIAQLSSGNVPVPGNSLR